MDATQVMVSDQEVKDLGLNATVFITADEAEALGLSGPVEMTMEEAQALGLTKVLISKDDIKDLGLKDPKGWRPNSGWSADDISEEEIHAEDDEDAK